MKDDPRFEVKNPDVVEALRKIAQKIIPDIPQGYGFSLLIFTFGEGGATFYISNAERESMIEAMKEFIARNEKDHANG